MPRGLLRRLSSPAQAVRHPCTRARRRPLSQGPQGTRQNRPAHPRQLGAREAQRRAASRSPGDHRRPLREAIHHRHQPGAHRSLVRHDRQSDARRCHPRPPRPQCLPHRTQRRELAKTAPDTIRRLTPRQSRAIQNNDPREHRLAGFGGNTHFAPLPATRMWMSPPICVAAVRALAVWSERLLLSWSARR